MIKLIAYTYADGEEEFLRHDEPSFDPRASEKCSLQGVFLTDSELEQLKREYFEAGREGEYVESLMTGGNYWKHKFLKLEDYEAQRLSSKKETKYAAYNHGGIKGLNFMTNKKRQQGEFDLEKWAESYAKKEYFIEREDNVTLLDTIDNIRAGFNKALDLVMEEVDREYEFTPCHEDKSFISISSLKQIIAKLRGRE